MIPKKGGTLLFLYKHQYILHPEDYFFFLVYPELMSYLVTNPFFLYENLVVPLRETECSSTRNISFLVEKNS